MTGTNQTVYGNLLLGNRYEISDGSGGGQIVLDADFNGAVTASNAVVAGNVVDGARTFNGNEVEWPAEAVYQKDGQGQYSFRFETDCLIVAPDGCFDGSSSAGCITRQLNSGLEVNGIGHSFYNNESSRHSGSGMQIGCSHPTRQIKISSANPWYVPDSVRFVEGNQAGGIVILGPIYTPKCQTTAGILLDDILVRNNAIAGVFVDSTQGDNLTDSRTGLPYQGFFNDACMSGNKDTLAARGVTP